MSKRTTTLPEGRGDLTEAASLVHLLRARAQAAPDRLAYTFLSDGDAEEEHLTYGQLDARARAVAAWLRRDGARGQRVLLLYSPGLEYNAAFWGCLYAGAVAVPAYPPRLNRSLLRLRSIAADARAGAALTTPAILARLEQLCEQAPELRALRWGAAPEARDGDGREEWEMPDVSAETLAFLQYTSGSTAAPKGVMVTHGNLLHNEELIRRAFGQTEDSVVVGWLPVYHDMGLIGNVLQPVYVGARCVLMSPAAFLQQPARWLRAISRYGATTSGGPNFAYDLCVRKVGEDERAGLDLSRWTTAFNGAEPVRAETLERFAAAFAACGFRREAFRPCYGLAESTLLVTAPAPGRAPAVMEVRRDGLERNVAAEAGGGEEARRLVGCGAAGAGHEVIVVNPETLRPCAAGEVGEIWVGGPSVAGGYWGRPDETAHAFQARLAGAGGGPYLRTGDLGFDAGGELFITGRLKDLIIIRGRNLYAHDVERAAEESHPSLRPGGGAAFSVEEGGEERLVVVQEVERRGGAGHEELIECVRRALAEEFEVQPAAVVLVRAGGVPKTSSGKVQRRAAREMFLAGQFEPLGLWRAAEVEGAGAPDGDGRGARADAEGVEGCLRAELSARVGVAAARIDADRPVLVYGLDSLQVIELAHSVESRLGVAFPLAELLGGESLSELAARIRRSLDEAAPGGPGEATDAAETHPLSHGQEALWFLHRVDPDSAAYNVTAAARVRGPLDAGVLRESFRELVARHPALRTTFEAGEGRPVRRVSERGQLCYEELDAAGLAGAELRALLAERARRPFDLAAGPLFRVSLLRRADDEHVLLLAAHHIVIDFWSLAVLVRELGALYEAGLRGEQAALPPAGRYDEYVRRQRRALEGAEGARLWDYWREQLGGGLPTLDLPTDRPRPPAQTFRGASHAARLDAGLARRLRALERASGATLYTLLLAAFQVLLSRHTGQDDVVVGSPAAGRGRAADAGVVGYFVNPLVLRADLSGDPTFEGLLAKVRRTVLDAFAHQDYPFPLLVQRLQPERDPSRPPLFQAMFVLQQTAALRLEGLAVFALGEEGARMRVGGLDLESVALEHGVAQFDLSLAAAEAGDELLLSWEYNTDLFDAATVVRMARRFEELLRGVVEDPGRRLSELPLLTDDERRLLHDWNQTGADYPLARPLHSFVEAQAARTPGATALVFGRERLTYAELDGRADRLARRLRRLGVGPDVLVGVMMERSAEMVVALLGVLKAGGAYVPLDPSYPAERLAFMLADAAAPVLL
ncbi:MAG TPA: condensation domain-containing protein, partial [Pyrinomonadaceae bacterium]|nr:condensation domain-containing protein [Pyrinomonadaceae bacterium]